MRRLQLTLDLPDRLCHPMQEFIRESDDVERSRLLSGNVLDDGTARFVFEVRGDRTAYRRALEAQPDVTGYDITPGDDGSFFSVIRREWRDRDHRLRAILEGSGAVIVHPVEFTGRGTVRTVVLGDREALQGVVRSVPEDATVDVERLDDRAAPVSMPGPALTSRQMEAVEVAVEMGYYDVPREAGLAAVAARLDCAESTASNHLRKAEAAVMRLLVDSR